MFRWLRREIFLRRNYVRVRYWGSTIWLPKARIMESMLPPCPEADAYFALLDGSSLSGKYHG